MLTLLVAAASAQDYRLPIADEHVELAYPTAYKDHGGVDWNCGDIRYDGHRGTDFGIGSWDGMAEGRDVVAAAAGVVTTAIDGFPDDCSTGSCGEDPYGNHVVVQHSDGKATIYGHMATGSVAVEVGQPVACGHHLGRVGSSGWSTGPHLHFGVYDPEVGDYVDPFEGECAAPPSYWTDQGPYGGLPGTTCDSPPACEPVATLGCGDRWTGTTSGATSDHAYWGCSEFVEYTGGEIALRLRPWPGDVVVTATGLGADLDLFLLASDACDALDCLASSTEGETADEAIAFVSDGSEVVLVADGYAGAASAITLEVTCSGEPPDTDAPEDTDPAADPGGRRPMEAAGCGCAQGSGGSGWLAALLAIATSRTRRTKV